MFTTIGIVKAGIDAAEEVGHHLRYINAMTTPLPLRGFFQTMTHGDPVQYASAIKKGNETQIVELVLDSLKELDKQGADFAIIPHCMVHKLSVFKAIEQQAPLRLIHMMNVVAKDCFLRKFQSVCFLGHSQEIDLYESPFREKGIAVVRPSKEDQKFLDIVCEAAEDSGSVTNSGQINIEEIFNKLKKQNHFNALSVTHSKLRKVNPWKFTQVQPINPLYSQALGAFEHMREQALLMQEFGLF